MRKGSHLSEETEEKIGLMKTVDYFDDLLRREKNF